MFARIPLALLLLLSLLLPSALGVEVICEELPPELCAFAVSSSGKRCVVERYRRGGEIETVYQCRKSEAAAERFANWVETDDCVAACGADRRMVGISSDALLDQRFTEKLCSPECYHDCPNMIDLYYNLAAAEGVVLSHLCETRRTNPIRAMAELYSSGAGAAAAPTATIFTAAKPSPSVASSGVDNTATSASVSAAPTATVPTADHAAAIADDTDAAPSDVSEFSIDSSSDELDADPVPVPAQSPSTFLDIQQEEDADFV